MKSGAMDRHAALAMTGSIVFAMTPFPSHCEERSDAVIQEVPQRRAARTGWCYRGVSNKNPIT